MVSSRRLILDANLAVLLIVGLADARLIASHRNLKAYDLSDLELLKAAVSMSGELLWCPHLASEVSNLIRQIGGPAKAMLTQALAQALTGAQEEYISSEHGIHHWAYPALGLNDAIIILLAQSGATLLTADLDLHLRVLGEGLTSVNFAELRDSRRDFLPAV